MARVATAEVEIIADTSRFIGDLRRKLRAAFNRLGNDSGRQLADTINRQLSKNLGNIGQNLNLDNAFRKVSRGLETSAERSGKRVTRAVDQAFNQLTAGVDNISERSGRQIARRFDQAFNQLTQGVETNAAKAGRRAAQTFVRQFTTEYRSLGTGVAQQMSGTSVREFEIAGKRSAQQFSRGFASGRVSMAQAGRNLSREISKELRKTKVTVDVDVDRQSLRNATRSIARGFSSNFSRGMFGGRDGGADSIIGKIFMRGISALTNAFGSLVSAGSSATGLLRGVASVVDGITDRLAEMAAQGSKGAQAIGGIIGAFQSAAGPIGAIVSAVIALVTAGFLLGSLVAGIGLVIQAVQSLLGVFVLLGAAVNSVVSGALASIPAIVAGLGVTVLALTSAFKGFFTAVGEGVDSQAFSDLTGSAQDAARAMIGLKSAFSDLQSTAQEAFFSGLSDEIDKLGSTFMPALSDATAAAASGLSDLTAGLLRGLASPQVASALRAIGTALQNAFSGLAEPLERAVIAFGRLAEAGAPVLEMLGNAVGNLLNNFSDWVDAAEESGRLQEIFDGMAATLSEIGGIVGNLIEGFGNLFGYAAADSLTFLENIRGATDSFREWTESDDAREFMSFLAEEAMAFGSFISNAIASFVEWASSTEGQTLMETLKDLAVDFSETMGEVFSAFLEWAQSPAGETAMTTLVFLAELFLLAVKTAFDSWTALGRSIEATIDWVYSVFDWMLGIARESANFLSNALSIAAVIFDWVAGLKTAYDWMLGLIGLGGTTRFGGGPTSGGSGPRPIPRALGGIVRSPEFTWLAEDGRPEAVIPLTRPARALSIMEQAGLIDLVLRNAKPNQINSVGGPPPAGGPPIEMHVHSNSVDPDLVARRAVNRIARAVVIR